MRTRRVGLLLWGDRPLLFNRAALPDNASMIVYTLNIFDLRSNAMKLFKRKEEEIEFCDRCGSVCDSRCRADALRERNYDRAIAARFGV